MILPLPMRVQRCDSVPVATLAGEVEISRVGNLRDRLLKLLDNRDFGLVVDLSRVTYVDSAGVNVLFDVADSLSGRQMRLATVVPKEGLVSRVVSMVALNTVAGVHEDRDAAVDEIRQLMPTGGDDLPTSRGQRARVAAVDCEFGARDVDAVVGGEERDG